MMRDELQELRAENKRMRDALIKIFKTGPVFGGYGGPGCSYKQLHLLHLSDARKGLGVPKLGSGSYQAAWEWIKNQGWVSE